MERVFPGSGWANVVAYARDKLSYTWRKFIPSEPLELLWWIFTVSVSTSVLSGFLGETSAPLTYLLAICGSAGCGWAWLMSRALFRAEAPIRRWNVYAIALIIAIEASWHVVAVSTGAGIQSEVTRLVGNATSLVCIGALAMIFVEALGGYSKSLPNAERRFRQIFVSVLAVLIVISLVWAANANEESLAGHWVDQVIVGCGFVGVIGSRMAVSFRKRHPLSAPVAARVQKSKPGAQDRELANRILNAIDEGQRFTTPDLKVADLASVLGEHEYKVTQCITGALGFGNFNQLVNSRRVALAKQMLADPALVKRPILTIAFDCGFGSIGPFNRAFKKEVGITPREFRSGCVANQN